jgi:hypothetical protein
MMKLIRPYEIYIISIYNSLLTIIMFILVPTYQEWSYRYLGNYNLYLDIIYVDDGCRTCRYAISRGRG